MCSQNQITGGVPIEQIQNETGLVVSGTDNKEIASAAVALLTNLEASQKMGTVGRQWIVDNWRWEIWSSQFNKLLQQ